MGSTGILGYCPAWQNSKSLRIGTYSILVYFICFGLFWCDVEFCGYIIPLGGQNKGFSSYWLKEMLIWEKDFVFVFLEKVIKVFTPSRVIWIRFDRGRPPEN